MRWGGKVKGKGKGRPKAFKVTSCPDSFYQSGSTFNRGDIADMLINNCIPEGAILEDTYHKVYYRVEKGGLQLILTETDLKGRSKDNGRSWEGFTTSSEAKVLKPV